MSAPALIQENIVNATTDPTTGIVTIPFLSNVTAGNTIIISTIEYDLNAGLINSIAMQNQSLAFNKGDVFTQFVSPNKQFPVYFAYSTAQLSTSQVDSVVLTFQYHSAPVSVIIQEWSNIPAGGISVNPYFSGGDYTGTTSAIDAGVNTTVEGTTISFIALVNNGNKAMTGDGIFPNPTEISDNTNTYMFGASTKVYMGPTLKHPIFTMPSNSQWCVIPIDLIIVPPPVVIQSTSNTSATSSVAKQFTSTTTTNNTLIANIYSNKAITSISGVGTWTLISDNNFNGTKHLAQYAITADGTQPTVTVNSTGATVMELHIIELSNLINPVVKDFPVITDSGTNIGNILNPYIQPFSHNNGAIVTAMACTGASVGTVTAYIQSGQTNALIIDTAILHTDISMLNAAYAYQIMHTGFRDGLRTNITISGTAATFGLAFFMLNQFVYPPEQY